MDVKKYLKSYTDNMDWEEYIDELLNLVDSKADTRPKFDKDLFDASWKLSDTADEIYDKFKMISDFIYYTSNDKSVTLAFKIVEEFLKEYPFEDFYEDDEYYKVHINNDFDSERYHDRYGIYNDPLDDDEYHESDFENEPEMFDGEGRFSVDD